MYIKGLFLLLLLTLTFTLASPVLGTNEHLTSKQLESLGFTKYEQINGNSLLYPFKKLREKIFSVPDQKLFETRFNELVYIANKRKTGFLGEAANSYISIAGKMMESKNSNLTGKAGQSVKVLEKLRDGYPANSLPWIQIQQAVDTTQRMI